MTAWPAPPLPTPSALRLLGKPGARVAVPLGPTRWSESNEADVAVLLAGSVTLADVVAQVPAPATLRAGTLVVILGDLAPSGGLLGRWARKARVARALRSTALLGLGYERLGAGIDPASGQDLAWGYVPAAPPT